MWRHVKQDDVAYVVKRHSCAGNVKLVVSNFRQVWTCLHAEEELLLMIQDQNPLMELSQDEFNMETIWTIFDGFLERSHKDIDSASSLHINVMEDHTLLFKFNSKVDSLVFKMNLTLLEENCNILFDEITGPLLSVANKLLASQEHLFVQLEKKDIEIAQFELEGATLQRRNVRTEKFNKEDFLKNNHCGGSLSEACVTDKVVNVINLMFNENIKRRASATLEQTTSSSRDCQNLVGDNVAMVVEENANQCKRDTKDATVKVPKKKRTKLNI